MTKSQNVTEFVPENANLVESNVRVVIGEIDQDAPTWNGIRWKKAAARNRHSRRVHVRVNSAPACPSRASRPDLSRVRG